MPANWVFRIIRSVVGWITFIHYKVSELELLDRETHVLTPPPIPNIAPIVTFQIYSLILTTWLTAVKLQSIPKSQCTNLHPQKELLNQSHLGDLPFKILFLLLFIARKQKPYRFDDEKWEKSKPRVRACSAEIFWAPMQSDEALEEPPSRLRRPIAAAPRRRSFWGIWAVGSCS